MDFSNFQKDSKTNRDGMGRFRSPQAPVSATIVTPQITKSQNHLIGPRLWDIRRQT